MDQMRETVEERREKATAGPNEPQYDEMEEAVVEARQRAEQNPSWMQGEDIPTQDVPEDERLSRPVGTETDSY